jgi:hypothetical protein
MVPLKLGKLSGHGETVHENLVNLFLRCDIKHLLEEPNGWRVRRATAGGGEEKLSSYFDINP